MNEKVTKRDKIRAEVKALEEECREKEKKKNICLRKQSEARLIKAENEARKEKIKLDLQLMNKTYENNKRVVDEDRKEIDQKMR